MRFFFKNNTIEVIHVHEHTVVALRLRMLACCMAAERHGVPCQLASSKHPRLTKDFAYFVCFQHISLNACALAKKATIAGRAIAVLEYTVPHPTLQLHACDACEVAWHGTVKVFMPLSCCSHAFPLSFRATQHSCRDTLNQDPCMQGFIKEKDLSQYGPLVEEIKSLLLPIQEVEIRWGCRSANSVAHNLPRVGKVAVLSYVKRGFISLLSQND